MTELTLPPSTTSINQLLTIWDAASEWVPEKSGDAILEEQSALDVKPGRRDGGGKRVNTWMKEGKRGGRGE